MYTNLRANNRFPHEPGLSTLPLSALLHLFWKRTSGIHGTSFWRPDGHPVTQPTVSMHRKKQNSLTANQEITTWPYLFFHLLLDSHRKGFLWK